MILHSFSCHKQRIIHGSTEIWNFSSSVQLDNSRVSATRHLRILLTRKSRLHSHFKKRTRSHSFMALNRASDVRATHWLSQTNEKNYRNFSREVIRFSSVVEIPIKHFSLYSRGIYLLRISRPRFSKDLTIYPRLRLLQKRILHSDDL